jgi:pimeloyl-ACP methyl ester carboxylesterase
MRETQAQSVRERPVKIQIGKVSINGDLGVPEGAGGVVLFAHGSGSSRFSPRNRSVAGVLRQAGLATLLMDLLTEEEEKVDMVTRHLRFDIPLLAGRLAGATRWLREDAETKRLRIGYFGSSTGAAAALVAAARLPDEVSAIVSRGGRPDLAGGSLPLVKAPTLLIVGGDDVPVIGMNREAMQMMKAKPELVIVPGASHLFEEPGKLEEAARLARDWFKLYLSGEEAKS